MKFLLVMVLSVLFCMVSFSSFSQNAKKDANGNFSYTAPIIDETKFTTTGKSYTDKDGTVYPVYASDKKGKDGETKLFIVKTTKKTGVKHKSTLKF